MKQQKIKIGDKVIVLQDLDNRHKLEFQSTMVDAGMNLKLAESVDYILKYVVVQPQGMKMDDFSWPELQALNTHAKVFLGLGEDSQVTVEILD